MSQRTMVATLLGIAQKQKGGKPVHEYEVRRAGMQYPDFVTLWDTRWEGDFPKLKVGEIYAFVVDAKPRGEGKKGEYLDFLQARTPTVSERQEAPATSQNRDGGDEAPARVRDDAVGQSIERQASLYAAVEWASARVAQGEKLSTYHVAQIADLFARWVRRDFTPKPISENAPPSRQDAKSETAAPEDDPEAIFANNAPQTGPSEADAKLAGEFSAEVKRRQWTQEHVVQFLREGVPGWPGWKAASSAQRQAALAAIRKTPIQETKA